MSRKTNTALIALLGTILMGLATLMKMSVTGLIGVIGGYIGGSK